MPWWSRLWHNANGSSLIEPKGCVRLTLPGWKEDTPDDDLRIWRDSDGDVLSLAMPAGGIDVPCESNEVELRNWCRELAQSRGGGLIEVHQVAWGAGPTAVLIYKRLQRPAYIYTGMLFTSIQGSCLVWTIVAGEHGTTGIREALVTAKLINEGTLTVDGYRRSWAQDPYDPTYQDVEHSVLRFMSDDESYDAEFPDHPLSKVRRVLAILPNSMHFDSPKPRTA